MSRLLCQNESITFSGYHQDFKEIFEKVEKKREDSLNTLQPDFQIIDVDRNNVLKNILEIYKTCNDLKNFYLLVKFKGENAEGDRVAREVYSLFIEQLIFTSCDGRMHFVPVIQPEFGEEEFKIAGKTLFHFYINYSLFLVQFCRSTIQYVMGIECKPSHFIRSFLDYVSKRDSEILHDTLYNMNFNREKIIEILSRYVIRLVPT